MWLFTYLQLAPMDSSPRLTLERRARRANQNPHTRGVVAICAQHISQVLELSGMRARENSVHMKSCD
jgi:hypothetical protein